jgi:hypothetical protein
MNKPEFTDEEKEYLKNLPLIVRDWKKAEDGVCKIERMRNMFGSIYSYLSIMDDLNQRDDLDEDKRKAFEEIANNDLKQAVINMEKIKFMLDNA